jgi:hypothetical protein
MIYIEALIFLKVAAAEVAIEALLSSSLETYAVSIRLVLAVVYLTSVVSICWGWWLRLSLRLILSLLGIIGIICLLMFSWVIMGSIVRRGE